LFFEAILIWVLQSLGIRWSKLLQYDMSVLEAVARLTHIRPHQLLTPYRSGRSSTAKVSPAVTEPHQPPRNNSRQHPRIAKGDMLSHSLFLSLSLSLPLLSVSYSSDQTERTAGRIGSAFSLSGRIIVFLFFLHRLPVLFFFTGGGVG
jgi:hypothetical protein